MPKIYFASGKTVDFDYSDVDSILLKMKDGGARLMRIKDHGYIPLNSSTIEFIEILPQQKDVPVEVKVPVVEETPISAPQEIKPESPVEKEERLLKEIMDKGSCTHDGDKLKLVYTIGVKGKRYFQKCTFCGYRSKFIKADSLTPDQIEGAEQYMEN